MKLKNAPAITRLSHRQMASLVWLNVPNCGSEISPAQLSREGRIVHGPHAQGRLDRSPNFFVQKEGF
jgi:hypothetical protein